MNEAVYQAMAEKENRHWWFLARREVLSRLIQRFAPRRSEKLKLCDLGCGTGANLKVWSRDYEVVGLEASETALRHAQKKLGAKVISGRLPDDLNFTRESFDIVILADVLEHIDKDLDSLRRGIELLRPGGILIASVPASPWLFSERDRQHHHKRRYSRRQFKQLLCQEAVKLELLSYHNATLFPSAVLTRLWSKWVRPPQSDIDLMELGDGLNDWLQRVLIAEGEILRWIRLPFGLSLIAVIRKI